MNTIFGRVKYIILCNIFKLLLDTMGAILKCYLLFVFVFCAFMITMGAMFNVFTIAAFPTCISQRIQHTIVEGIGEVFEGIGEKIGKIVEEIGEEIGEKVPKREMPALVWIILFDALIILLAMIPKMTLDQCKIVFEGKKYWDDVAILASMTVNF